MSRPLFSILLPSRNRAELLRHAVNSVLEQGFGADAEIIVADNASDPSYGPYVASLGAIAARSVRSDVSLPVTENWNRALAASTGRYIIMLGDDDALAPGWLARARALIAQFDQPAALYVMAYHYCYPGVIPGQPDGYFATVDNADVFRGAAAPYALPRDTAAALGAQVMGFRHRFSFNAQHFVWSRAFIDSLDPRGGLFQSPYPDYHAAILTMAEAPSIVVVPTPEVIIGISPKSFGFFYQNRQFGAGQAMLGNDGATAALGPLPEAVQAALAFPGSAHYRNWLIAALAAARSLGQPLDEAVDLRRYRRLQMIEMLVGGVEDGMAPSHRLALLMPHLHGTEQRLLARLRWLDRLRSRLPLDRAAMLDRLGRMRGIYTAAQVTNHDIGRHRSISDAFRWLARTGRAATPAAKPEELAIPPLPVLHPIHTQPGRPSVAVVYLARSGDGSVQDFQSFIASYRAHDAGIAHDLVIIRKGLVGHPGSQAALSLMLAGIPHRVVDVSDEGFDIQAYLKVAPALRHDRVCFLNTFSQINAPQWLRHLDAALDRPGIGMAGATASYESLLTSLSLLVKVIWLTAVKNVQYAPNIARQYHDQLSDHAAAWMAKRGSRMLRFKREVARRWLGRPFDTKELEAGFHKYWDQETREGGSWALVRQVKAFPNPHLRSNAFIIDRALLVELDFRLENTKTASNLFECGTDGLPARLARRGLAQMLVGADGTGYAVEQWPQSRTFRLGDQANVMVTDNQVRGFTAMSDEQKRLHTRMSWGDYLPDTAQGLIDFGIKFPIGSLEIAQPTPAATAAPAGPMLSVVIPFTQGLDALRDALDSFGRQPGDCECVILDNASGEPVADLVATRADPRIRIETTDRRLGLAESWNSAVAHARGTYVTLLGARDALAPEHGARIAGMIEEFGHPELIYTPHFRFVAPGTSPGLLAGMAATVQAAGFLRDRPIPFHLFPEHSLIAAIDALEMRRDFATAMPCFCFRRDFLLSLARDGAVFRTARPDEYIATLAMALGIRIIVTPQPLVILGVVDEGEAEDATQADVAGLLPGPRPQAASMLAMIEAAARLGDRAPADAGLARYRRHQILAAATGAAGGMRWMQRPPGAAIWPKLTREEKLWALRITLTARLQAAAGLPSRHIAALRQDLALNPVAPVETHRVIGTYARMTDFLDDLSAGRYPPG